MSYSISYLSFNILEEIPFKEITKSTRYSKLVHSKVCRALDFKEARCYKGLSLSSQKGLIKV